MADNKEMKKLDLEDLEGVNGGLELTEWATSLLSGTSVAAKPGLGVGQETASLGNQQPGMGGQVESYCPDCRRNTLFMVYSGGRGICQECGNQKDM